MTDSEKLDAALSKYGPLEVAMTFTVQEMTDLATIALIGAGLVENLPPAVMEFLNGVEGILGTLQDAIESGEEIVAL